MLAIYYYTIPVYPWQSRLPFDPSSANETATIIMTRITVRKKMKKK